MRHTRNSVASVTLVTVLIAAFLGGSSATAATSCDVRIAAPADLQQRLNAAGEGKTVCLSGTFRTRTEAHPLHGQVIVGGVIEYTGGYNITKARVGRFVDGLDLHAGNITVRDVEIRGFEGRCIVMGPNTTVRDSYLHDCRQNGISAYADNADWHLQIIGNRIMHNGWPTLEYVAAGGVKLLNLSRPGHCLGCGAIVTGNTSANNFGNGIWFDQSSSGIVANGNTTYGNNHFGMRCEKCAGPVSWTGNTSHDNDMANYSLRNTATIVMSNNVSYGSKIGIYVAYGGTDSKTYPNLGDEHEGYHPYRLIVNDTRLARDGVNGCQIRNVVCHA